MHCILTSISLVCASIESIGSGPTFVLASTYLTTFLYLLPCKYLYLVPTWLFLATLASTRTSCTSCFAWTKTSAPLPCAHARAATDVSYIL